MKILLGITGGIAAYKSATLVRLFMKNGHDVRVMMTPKATDFIEPLTFSSLTGNSVLTSITESKDEISHIEYATWADICVIAPATANTIGKLANGIADNALLSTTLALRVPLVLAPAMNTGMWVNPAVVENINKMKKWGIHIIEPDSGELACGDVGQGRMREPENISKDVEEILAKVKSEDRSIKSIIPDAIINKEPKKNVDTIINEFSNLSIEEYLDEPLSDEDNLEGLEASKPFDKINILVTAGPTREYIDPVRYITNRSSGKMGYAIANSAKAMGAKVTLISGKVDVDSTIENIITVETAADMAQAVMENLSKCDILIMAAAVADYRPSAMFVEKIKKTNDTITLELVKNNDILMEVKNLRTNKQIIVGFAAETEDIIENAKSKLERKNLDMIVVNNVGRKDIGFDVDNNEVDIIFKDGKVSKTGFRSKDDIAKIVLTEAAILFTKAGL